MLARDKGSPLSVKQKERVECAIVAFPPALFLNPNNICTLREGCEKRDPSRCEARKNPKSKGERGKKSQKTSLALVQRRASITGFKSIFFSFTSHNPLDEN